MAYLGVDPGLGGALAVVSEAGTALSIYDMPTLKTTKSRRILDEETIVGLIHHHTHGGPLRAVVEAAMVLPKQGSASGFKIGIGYGQILGMLAALRIPRIIVAPQKWQAAILGKCEPGTSKDRARAFAQRMWPEVNLGQRKSQDRADAMLLALYGIRHWAAAPAEDAAA